MRRLTPRVAIFYGEYIKDGNATRAAIVAGCPESSASVTAARWLKSKTVRALLDNWSETRRARDEAAAEEVLQTLTDLVRADVGHLYDRDGRRIPVHLLDDVTRAAIAAVEDETTEGPGYVTTRKQKIKMADKIRAAELLGRYHKLFTDRVEHDGRVTLEQLVSGRTEAA